MKTFKEFLAENSTSDKENQEKLTDLHQRLHHEVPQALKNHDEGNADAYDVVDHLSGVAEHLPDNHPAHKHIDKAYDYAEKWSEADDDENTRKADKLWKHISDESHKAHQAILKTHGKK